MELFGADSPDGYDDRPPRAVTHLRCVEHGCPGKLVIASVPWGWQYQCTVERCPGSMPANKDGSPRGKPRLRSLQEARRAAHAAFDPLWQAGHVPRGVAYRWLQDVMRMSSREAHMFRMNAAQCVRVVRMVRECGPGTTFWGQWIAREQFRMARRRGGRR